MKWLHPGGEISSPPHGGNSGLGRAESRPATNRDAAQEFVRHLHAGLAGWVALLLKSESGKLRTVWTRAGQLPALPGALPPDPAARSTSGSCSELHAWISVATFDRRRRLADHALQVKAAWVDLDPPKTAEGAALVAWREDAFRRLLHCRPAPSLVIDSGRGWHAYWLLREPVRLEGPDRSRLAALLVSCNRALALGLDGDAVHDLSRVMRLPGTVNPKAGGGPCRIVEAGGPRYTLAELQPAILRLDPETPAAAPRSLKGGDKGLRAVESNCEQMHADAPPRGRGRPALGATVRDLRELPPWARALVVGGVWAAGTRYVSSGRMDRSKADMAAVNGMVAAGWSDERIAAAFTRTAWLIGVRYRELRDRDGVARADDYLRRTIGRARTGRARSEGERG